MKKLKKEIMKQVENKIENKILNADLNDFCLYKDEAAIDLEFIEDNKTYRIFISNIGISNIGADIFSITFVFGVKKYHIILDREKITKFNNFKFCSKLRKLFSLLKNNEEYNKEYRLIENLPTTMKRNIKLNKLK